MCAEILVCPMSIPAYALDMYQYWYYYQKGTMFKFSHCMGAKNFFGISSRFWRLQKIEYYTILTSRNSPRLCINDLYNYPHGQVLIGQQVRYWYLLLFSKKEPFSLPLSVAQCFHLNQNIPLHNQTHLQRECRVQNNTECLLS